MIESATERGKLQSFVEMHVEAIAGPLNNSDEAQELIEKITDLSNQKTQESGVLYRTIHAIWRMAYDKTDVIPNDVNKTELAYYLGIRNFAEVMLQEGFSVTKPLAEFWAARQEIMGFQEEVQRAEEEAMKNRPPAD